MDSQRAWTRAQMGEALQKEATGRQQLGDNAEQARV